MDMHLDGVIFQGHAAELGRRIHHPHPPFAVLDIRPDDDFRKARVPGSRRIAPGGLDALPEGTDSSTEFFILGSGPDGLRPVSTALRNLGARRVVEVPGGLLEWAREGLPVEDG